MIAGCSCLFSFASLAAAHCTLQLRSIGSYSVPAETYVDSYRFGGISGLDYDGRTGQWYLVSDDRKEYQAARIFAAELKFDSQRVIDVALHSGRLVDDAAATDAEGIRVDPQRRELLLAGEGDADRRIGPWLRRTDFSGHVLEQIRLPPLFEPDFRSERRGPRPNESIEGIAFDSQGGGLWIALEAPLRQDGPAASVDRGADVRLTLRDAAGKSIGQHVYSIDAARAHAPGESSDSGISEILASNDHELLVLERSGTRAVDGSFRFHTRLYCADTTDATDVAALDSLVSQSYVKVAKRLLYDFDSLRGLTVDNLEGMSWGPALSGAQRSLVFVSDNNMVKGLATQFIVFAASP